MSDADDRPTINRQHWMNLGLNGGRYIDDPEDRTNFLLNEWERLFILAGAKTEPARPPCPGPGWEWDAFAMQWRQPGAKGPAISRAF